MKSDTIPPHKADLKLNHSTQRARSKESAIPEGYLVRRKHKFVVQLDGKAWTRHIHCMLNVVVKLYIAHG